MQNGSREHMYDGSSRYIQNRGIEKKNEARGNRRKNKHLENITEENISCSTRSKRHGRCTSS